MNHRNINFLQDYKVDLADFKFSKNIYHAKPRYITCMKKNTCTREDTSISLAEINLKYTSAI